MHTTNAMIVEHHRARTVVRAAAALALASLALAALVVSGCSGKKHDMETGWSDSGKVQVQFYSPPGATVAVKECRSTRRHQIAEYPEPYHRLELAPEEFSVFNLSPGRHQFKYTTAPGFPGVSIYGELEIRNPCDAQTRKFVRNSFVPVRLPARYYTDEPSVYPTAGVSGAGLVETEVERLAQGDMIEKVYFVADLEAISEDLDRIETRLARLRSAEIVLNSSMEYHNTRYEEYRRDSLYSDPAIDVDAAADEFWGSDREFIRIEGRRQKLENQRDEIRSQMDSLTRERQIRRSLLDSIEIINRAGALVLATPQNQWPYRDTYDQVDDDREYDGISVSGYDLGEFELEPMGHVVAVVRVGGRHKQWGEPSGEMVSFSPDTQ